MVLIPIILTLIVTVSLGVLLFKKNVHKAWAFVTPLGALIVYWIMGRVVVDPHTLDGLLFFFEGVAVTVIALVLNAIILGTYLWRQKSRNV